MIIDSLAASATIARNINDVPAWKLAVKDLLCITVYNEPLSELHLSLDAVAEALLNLAEYQLESARHFGICLVLDGAEQTSSELLAWLCNIRLLPSVSSDEGVGWQMAALSLAALSPAVRAAHGQTMPAQLTIPVWAFVKSKNCGKLDSHAVFFDGLCAALQPRHVYQLDAGTTIARSAFIEIIRCFEHDNVGAVSSRCAAIAPTREDGILAAWQFFDTAQQLSTQWPAECLTGYLSVIPGQFCAFRWSALYQGGNHNSPLRHYLHGIHVQSMYERVMFLAEDRVVGQALMLAHDKEWKLEYGVDVQATNDVCSTLPELMHQRRRWNNGANACRLNMLWRWREFLQRSDRTAIQKFRFSSAMMWQLLLFITQLFAPAVFAANLSVIGKAVHNSIDQGRPMLPLLMGSGVIVGTLFWRKLPKNNALSWAALRDTAWWIALLACIGLFARTLSLQSTLLLFGARFFALYMTARLYRIHSRVLWRRSAEYVWIDLPLHLLLWAYSVLKLGNTAWGTKGLQGSIPLKIHWQTAWALPLWIGLNAVVIYFWSDKPGWFFHDLPALMELSALMCSISVTGSLVFFATRKLAMQRTAKTRYSIPTPVLFKSSRASYRSSQFTTQLPISPETQTVREARVG